MVVIVGIFSWKISEKINGKKHSHRSTTNTSTAAPSISWRNANLWLTPFIIMNRKWLRFPAATMMHPSCSRNSACSKQNKLLPPQIGGQLTRSRPQTSEQKKFFAKLTVFLKALTVKLCQTRSICQEPSRILSNTKQRFRHQPQKLNFQTF
jgi:hypothetical protein